MSERILSLLLLDIKVSIGKILEYTAGMTEDIQACLLFAADNSKHEKTVAVA